MQKSLLFLLLLSFHLTSVLGGRKYELSATPPKGVTGAHTNGNNIDVYYGDDVWWHAKHAVDEGWAGKLFGIAKDAKEHDQNRATSASTVKTGSEVGQPGLVRDEKPCAIMSYRPENKATVWLLPSSEQRWR